MKTTTSTRDDLRLDATEAEALDLAEAIRPYVRRERSEHGDQATMHTMNRVCRHLAQRAVRTPDYRPRFGYLLMTIVNLVYGTRYRSAIGPGGPRGSPLPKNWRRGSPGSCAGRKG